MILTLAHLGTLVARHGLELRSISVHTPPRIVMRRWGDLDGQLQLELTVFVVDENGKRFKDESTGEAAVEKRIIPFEVEVAA